MNLVAVVIVAGLLYYTLAAFEDPASGVETGDHSEARARAEVESALLEIIDLEADFDTGKLSEADFLAARGDAERKAARHFAKEKHRRETPAS